MSRAISLTTEQIEQFVEEFRKSLVDGNFSDGGVKFQKELPKATARAKIFFTPMAWIKQSMLLDTCDKEVAWHGVAERIDGEEAAYLISDIVVYPQTVTASTVDMDTEKYAVWLQEHIEADDERFNNLRMQAHSHVNMGVTPSGVDMTHQKEIVRMMRDGSFYIFMIYNKRREFYARIIDKQKNLEFEKSDIDVYITDTADFAKEIKDNVVSRTYNYSYGSTTIIGGKSDGPKPVTEKKEEPKKDEPKKELPSGDKPIVKFEDNKKNEPMSFRGNACSQYDDWCDEYDGWYDAHMRGRY